MNLRATVVTLWLVAAPAYAQPAPQPPSNAGERIGATIGRLTIDAEMKADQIVALQEQVRQLQQQLAAAKAAAESAKPKEEAK